MPFMDYNKKLSERGN